jgi:serine/threonine-protein kinase
VHATVSNSSIDLGIPGIGNAVEIGRGGFAVVYRAFQPKFRRTVAVKVLTMSATDEVARARFDRECQAMGLLSDHPNIVTVYDSGYTEAGRPYLVMAYLPQGTLADRLGRDGVIAAAEVSALGVTLAEALHAAHQAGVLHRDVKPSNILVSNFGAPQLADFGIARLADATVRSLTGFAFSPAYAAPEVLAGHEPTAASDVYSLAASLYELLVGRPAFFERDEDNLFAVMARVATDPVPDLRTHGVPDSLAGAIERALRKDPAERTPSGHAFAAELRAATDDGVSPAPESADSAAASSTGTLPAAPLAGVAPRGTTKAARAGAESPDDSGPRAPARSRWPRSTTIASATVLALVLVVGAVVLLRPNDAERPGGSGGGPTGPIAGEVVLNGPIGLAAGKDGEVFIADTGGQVVRRWSRDGRVVTVAGNGTAGFSGDGGPAVEAQLHDPYGVAVAEDGAVYIADDLNSRVRLVDRDGRISTVAGGGRAGGDGRPGTQAGLMTPTSVAVAADGSIFIAEAHGHRVRRLRTNGIITTLAGTGEPGFSGDGGPATSARLNTPIALALGSDGAVYVADRDNHRIRRIAPDGAISTVAGTGAAGFGGDGGRAIEASMNGPGGVAVASDGTVYVADTLNHRVRRIDSTGMISTVAGDGRPGSSGDGGPATAGALATPQGIVVDSEGGLVVAERGANRIRRIDRDGVITTLL